MHGLPFHGAQRPKFGGHKETFCSVSGHTFRVADVRTDLPPLLCNLIRLRSYGDDDVTDVSQFANQRKSSRQQKAHGRVWIPWSALPSTMRTFAKTAPH